MNKLECSSGFSFLLWFDLWSGTGGLQPAGRTRIEGIRPGQPLESAEMARILENHFQKMIQNPSRKVAIGEFRGYEQVIVPRENFSCQVQVTEKAIQGGNIAGMMVFFCQWAGDQKNQIQRPGGYLCRCHDCPGTFLKKHHEIQAERYSNRQQKYCRSSPRCHNGGERSPGQTDHPSRSTIKKPFA